eukprot:6192053-Pleurochrysis_carterae.AAC.4
MHPPPLVLSWSSAASVGVGSALSDPRRRALVDQQRLLERVVARVCWSAAWGVEVRLISIDAGKVRAEDAGVRRARAAQRPAVVAVAAAEACAGYVAVGGGAGHGGVGGGGVGAGGVGGFGGHAGACGDDPAPIGASADSEY